MHKTRKAKKASRTTRKIFPKCKEIYNSYVKNPKTKIVRTVQGQKAVEMMKQLLFESSEDADRWAKTWSAAEQKQALFFAVVQKKRKTSTMSFHLCLPKGNDFSAIGENVSYAEGVKKLKMVK